MPLNVATRSALSVGRRILCRYRGEDPPLWHERLLLGHLDGGVWIIATPDGDVYAEDYDADDYDGVRVQPAAGGRPPGLVGRVYPFRAPPSAAERATWDEAARTMLANHTPVVVEEPVPLPVLAAPPGAPPQASRPAGRPTRPAGTGVGDGLLSDDGASALGAGHARRPPAVPGHAWIAVGPLPGEEVGAGTELVDQFISCLCFDTKGVFVFENGNTVHGELRQRKLASADEVLFARLSAHAKAIAGGEEWVPSTTIQPTAEDPRCLAVRLDERQKRFRDWAGVTAGCSEVPMTDWPVDGPRSAAWVVSFLARNAPGGPEQYHKWWRTTARLSIVDWGVAEHQQLCRYLELAGTYDQLDLANVSTIEAIVRRLQLVEYQYRERLRDGSQGGVRTIGASSAVAGMAVMAGEEADLFDGVSLGAGGACVCPKLLEHISSELGKTAAIDKAARKAREEKAFARTGAVDIPTAPLVPLDTKGKKGDKTGKGGGK